MLQIAVGTPHRGLNLLRDTFQRHPGIFRKLILDIVSPLVRNVGGLIGWVELVLVDPPLLLLWQIIASSRILLRLGL